MTSGLRLVSILAFVACVSTLVAAQTPQRLRVGGGITRPQKIVHVDPIYPAKAKADRIEGMVIVETVIATDGTVKDIEVIRSAHPLLDAAAIEAVSQWEFTPTLLNGEPVELVMSVNVTFALERPAPAPDGGAPPPPPPPPPS